MRKHGTAGDHERKIKLPPLPTYKTVKDNPRMGLNNQPCKNPVSFCTSKQVFLNKEDMKEKRCLYKPTLDMIGTEVCKKLVPIERI